MKKLLMVLVAIVIVSSLVPAQEIWGEGKMSAGAGAEVALPLGTWGDVNGLGIGGFGLFQYGITPEILLTGQVGYTMWMEKEVSGAKYSSNALTILAGAKYDLSAQVTKGFYGMLQLGIYSLTQKDETVILPGVGYQFDNFDVSVKYTLKGNFDNVCLNVAYVMPL
jgi:hypothetical protein